MPSIESISMALISKFIGSIAGKFLQGKSAQDVDDIPKRYGSLGARVLHLLSYADVVGVLSIIRKGKFNFENLGDRAFRKKEKAAFERKVISWLKRKTGLDRLEISHFIHNDKKCVPLDKATEEDIRKMLERIETELAPHFEEEYEIILDDDADWLEEDDDQLEN